MTKKIVSVLRKIHHNTPPRLRNNYKFVLTFLKKLGSFILPVGLYTVNLSNSEEKISFIHVGWDKKLCNYWLNKISDRFELQIRRKIFSWNIYNFINKKKYDIAIIESPLSSFSPRNSLSFVLPRWIEMELDVEISLKKARVDNIKRNIKKYSMYYEVKDGIKEFDYFYHTMYVPYLNKRHGKSAEISDYKHFSGKFLEKKSLILFIIIRNEAVAGAFIDLSSNAFRLSTIGIKDGSDEIFRKGVLGALYYFFMIHFFDREGKTVLLGKSMPVVFDGVTEFKMQLGAKPKTEYLNIVNKYSFLCMRDKGLVSKFLNLNPLFYLDNGALNIAAFCYASDFNQKDDFLRFLKRLKPENANKTKIYFFDNYEKIVQWFSETNDLNLEFIRFK